ncbi:MAG: hypothetical protein AVDCRST_MAG27-2379, partial [uncultured Craurococcus sp.]
AGREAGYRRGALERGRDVPRRGQAGRDREGGRLAPGPAERPARPDRERRRRDCGRQAAL